MAKLRMSEDCQVCRDRRCEVYLPGLRFKAVDGVLLVSDVNMIAHREEIYSAANACPTLSLGVDLE